jgi:hypothetical protein
MGLLGLDSTRLIADRIFYIMDSNRTGTVHWDEYLDYMYVLMYGS